MKVLITGGNGLLGRELCSQWVGTWDITSLVHREVEEPIDGVTYVVADLAGSLDYSTLPSEVDVVIHLAQSSRFRDFPDGARDTFQVNVASTLNLLEYSRLVGVRQFFLASTGGVYENQSGAITEAGALIPPSRIGLYFASKLSAEMIASTYRSCFEVSVLRFFFMYGPRQRPDMFLPRLVHRVMDGEPLQIDNLGGIRVNPIHVSDAARLFGRLIGQTAPQVLNVAGPEVASIREIGETIGRLSGRNVSWEIGGSSIDIVADVTAMSEFLVGSEMMPLDRGLQELVEVALDLH